MADHTENNLRAIIKALTDVVAPAIDPADSLAQEQLRLVVDYVRFMQQRIDLLADRHRFELERYRDMAEALVRLDPPASPEVRQALDAALEAAGELPASARLVETRAVTAALTGGIRRLVREAARFEPGMRRSIEGAVLEHSSEIVSFERAWYLPLGFDPAPREVAPVETILARADQAARP